MANTVLLLKQDVIACVTWSYSSEGIFLRGKMRKDTFLESNIKYRKATGTAFPTLTREQSQSKPCPGFIHRSWCLCFIRDPRTELIWVHCYQSWDRDVRVNCGAALFDHTEVGASFIRLAITYIWSYRGWGRVLWGSICKHAQTSA